MAKDAKKGGGVKVPAASNVLLAEATVRQLTQELVRRLECAEPPKEPFDAEAHRRITANLLALAKLLAVVHGPPVRGELTVEVMRRLEGAAELIETGKLVDPSGKMNSLRALVHVVEAFASLPTPLGLPPPTGVPRGFADAAHALPDALRKALRQQLPLLRGAVEAWKTKRNHMAAVGKLAVALGLLDASDEKIRQKVRDAHRKPTERGP